MEVGAVKQAFNNEVILLKKKLNQAKIQIIHKLTRKAVQLTEKKAPEPLKEKLKRKAENAVQEVLIIKKIKPKDIAKFIVTHKGHLKDFLNKPKVDNDKACARLLLHKALQDKYKFIRGRFSNVPIQDLFMSRLERRKMKKEEKEKKNNKKKGKDTEVINSEGDWDVEDVEINNKKDINDGSDDDDVLSESHDELDQNDSHVEKEGSESEQSEADEESDDENISKVPNVLPSEDEDNSEPEMNEANKSEKPNPKSKTNVDKNHKLQLDVKSKPVQREINIKPREINNKNPEKKQKELNKNKNFNEKIQQRKFKKDIDAPVAGNKIVDPFFITSTGENYMSVVEPRAPDEIKEVHKQGNRKLRRAVMFGHVPKVKPRYENNNFRDNDRFSKQNGNDFRNKFDNRQENNDRKSFRNDFNDRKPFKNGLNDKKRFNDKSNEEPEKLHPSWEAKKKKSGILPFEGKKIVFD